MVRQFQEIIIDKKHRELAAEHAYKRTREIVRQFVPRNAPLSEVESNFTGVLGEIAVRKYLGLNTILEDNYHKHQIDDGDIEYEGLVYDVKTDAVVNSSYKKIYDGSIKPYEPYACRVFTAKHVHHLHKYTGGLIFCVFNIPDNARATKVVGQIRNIIYNNDKILISGYVKQADVTRNPPTWYSPENPYNGHKLKYNSDNYIFHHTDLVSLADLCSIK